MELDRTREEHNRRGKYIYVLFHSQDADFPEQVNRPYVNSQSRDEILVVVVISLLIACSKTILFLLSQPWEPSFVYRNTAILGNKKCVLSFHSLKNHSDSPKQMGVLYTSVSETLCNFHFSIVNHPFFKNSGKKTRIYKGYNFYLKSWQRKKSKLILKKVST